MESKEYLIYALIVREAKAQMKIEEDKYIVLKGSTAVIDDRDSALPAIVNMRLLRLLLGLRMVEGSGSIRGRI